MKRSCMVFGEVLYDVYPTHKKLGGAPFNFGAHFAKLGGKSYIYSAVGNDALGAEIFSEVNALGVDTSYLAVTDGIPTGACSVSYNGDSPVYELKDNVSYDNIPFNAKAALPELDIFYFGTLALRHEPSLKTWKELLFSVRAKEKFLDLNLRGDFYSDLMIREVLSAATAVKLNREEYAHLAEIFSIEGEIHDFCRRLCRDFEIKLLIVTLDKDGALAYDARRDELVRRSAKQGSFVSAVGAGDSFSACFMFNYLLGAPLSACIEKATELASLVVSVEAAIPEYDGSKFKV